MLYQCFHKDHLNTRVVLIIKVPRSYRCEESCYAGFVDTGLKLSFLFPSPHLGELSSTLNFGIRADRDGASIRLSRQCELRSLIRFLCQQTTVWLDIYSQLFEVYGEKCMNIQHVLKWCREFEEQCP
ncbi:hypothetical protein NPIL_266441 [Nephila pilipes]|uniref:Uncharacterized protein n=1 Tax=Nephila pilipes TaxID=299642 RepID=A0A8X6UCV7_NEPPI|nr:hypothetical protein NPIL_266441 [Nephila pilipes]